MTEKQRLLSDGETATEKKPELGAFIFVVVGFPFHFLFTGVKVGAVGRAGRSHLVLGGWK